jgi:uroporphyrin-III C-methyltransferase
MKFSSQVEPGTVSFVGAGPGAPDLLTLRAIRLLQSANVVLHDALGTQEVLQAYCGQAKWVAVGKRAGRASTEQSFINQALVEYASQNHRVVRLKGGDPTVFGRLDEEIAALRREGILYTVAAGITAASAAAAGAGISLTRRGIARSLSLATPAVQAGDDVNDSWTAACPPGSTIAVYMSGRTLALSARQLLHCGHAPDTPVLLAHAVSNASESLHRTTLSRLSLGEHELSTEAKGSPCVMIVGEVAASSADDSSAALQAAGSTRWPAHRTIASRISGDSVRVGETSN